MKASGSSCLVVALEETTVSKEDPDPAGLGAKGTTVRDFVCRNNESAYMTLT